MLRSDPKFVREQIAASVYAGKRESVLIKAIIKALDDFEADASESASIDEWVDVALDLYRGHPIVTLGDDRRWEDFLLGDAPVRSTVRVKTDAYTGEAGRTHNGRVGRVVGGAGYNLSVLYEDGQPPKEPVLHKFDRLQILVK